MGIVHQLRAKFAHNQFEFSRHALDRTILRLISIQEIREAIQSCELLEDYPDDKYGPSCLLLGFTQKQRPLHIQCSHPARPLVKVITVYEPDPTEWIEWRVRQE
jgi:hypothetical protein